MGPFHIQAQVLRQRQLEPAAALGIFEAGTRAIANPAEGPRKSGWRKSDIKRLIAAAEQAGLTSYRVEVAPDGALSLIVGAREETARSDPYADLLP
jgi:hypothetical protein